ncbi:Rieske 2Fe-2S domain-containing protein [Paraburkholderia sp. A1RI_3L]|uniref:Rieske 2Fe-2S domain-containing protein n=1 Tax=Paraburkholderia TaxID=1822464 RepID=UPI000477EC06|nr:MULTISPECIES: Rieske 2Fe-2S domain-containing protein [Paraburkholderia]WEY37637.1 Rieske 2Fe-2S domain-containing protein [Paraburkholderia sp. SUR17]
MLTREENDLLTRVSNGAPMGQMIRQNWWIPAALSDKLEADGKPLRVQLFGEQYVAFRATSGKVGFFDEACPHRRASLALGRNEDNALRCIFHGWKFNVDGVTVAVPTQPNNEAEYCKHVPLRHYPVREEAGIVWVWLGEGDTPPRFPELPFVGLPRENFVVFRQKVNSNWLQGVETTMDSAHLGVLHQSWLVGFGDIEFSSENMAPVYHIAQKPFGFRYAAVRALKDGRAYVRTNSFVLPWFGIVSPNRADIQGGSIFFSVPIDDENIYYWQMTYRVNEKLVPNKTHAYEDPDSWPPLPPGPPEDNWGQDRDAMKQGHFTGFTQMLGTEDFAVMVSMGPIVDRSKEYLGAGDGAILAVRRCLLKALREFMDNSVPTLARHEEIDYPSTGPISGVFRDEVEWRALL